MIIVEVKGGLGNQMQQYALYCKLRSLGKDVKLDLSWFDEDNQKNMLAPRSCELLKFRNLPFEECTEEEKRELLGSSSFWGKAARKLHLGGKAAGKRFTESRMYHPEIFGLEDAYLDGYFACTKYYEDILGELRKVFVFPESAEPSVNAANQAVITEMEDAYTFSCAVHIRRGDYLDPENAPLLGGICTESYYQGAIDFLERAVEAARSGRRIHFYVFSDDPGFAHACRFGNLGEEITVCDWNKGEDSLLDMQLMMHCNGVIAANSTFSFWGGRLNSREPKILIRPLRHRNNQIPDPEAMRDYWKGWTLVDTDGKAL